MARVVLITGASSGIGKASAAAFKQAGYITYASARREASLTELREQGFHTVQLDVIDEASVVQASEQMKEQHGGVDILVNNAGYGLNGPVEMLPLADVRQQFETNVFGLLRLTQLVLPNMRRKGWGRVINVGSVGGTFTSPGAGAYHASKYALESFSDALRAEVKGFGVDVVLIQPTGVYTEFSDKLPAKYPDVSEDNPYHFFIRNHKKVATDMFKGPNRAGLITAEKVAATILKAAGAKRPRTRYKVGVSAHIYSGLRRILPDRIWDSMLLGQFRMEPK